MLWEFCGKHIDKLIGVLIIIICFVLIITGIDGEVKSVYTLAAGWVFGSGFATKRASG